MSKFLDYDGLEHYNEKVQGQISQLGLEATKGYDSIEQSPTALTKLQINPTSNTFTSTTSGKVRVYYVPCTSGQSFRVTATGGSSAVFRAAYSAAVPAAGEALTVLYNQSLASIDFIVEVPANGFFSVYCNAQIFPNVKIYSVSFTDIYQELLQNRAAIVQNKTTADENIVELRGQMLACVRLVGAGTTSVYSDQLTSIISGHTYRFYLKNWPFGQGGSHHVFEVIGIAANDAESVLVYERGDSLSPSPYYEITLPSDIVSIKIQGRITSGTTGECYIQDVTAIYEATHHLKICLLGNSYTADAWRYVPTMLLAYGIICKIEFHYRGSCSLWDLDDQWNNATTTDIGNEDGSTHSRFHYICDSSSPVLKGNWINDTIMSANDIIRLDKWDIVIIQQRGNYCKEINSYSPYLQNVIDKIMAACNYPFSLWWFEAYNGAAENTTAGANQASLDAQERIYKAYPFGKIIPAAATVFGGQMDADFAALGDSTYKRMYASDNVHLQEGLPCYLAACSVVQAILDKYKPGVSVLGDQFRPTAANIKGLGMTQTINGESIGVTDANCKKAQKMAVIASRSPFDIQPPLANLTD